LDITDLEKVEQDKMRLEGQLQHALRMKSVGTLAGGVAHNFNNMLMGILGNTSLALLQTSPEQPLYSNLKAIQKLVHSGSELTKQLLGYAMEGGYEPKVMSLNMLVKELSETFATMRKEVLVHCQFDEDLHPVVADRAQIEQVLLNLYLNAADAMPNGGSLYLRTMNATKDDMAGQPYTPKQGNYAHLSVRDTGTGMDKETLGRIFEPFFTTKGLAKGTGLGLASSYGIIKAHGGYIDVESEVGNGTTFHIYLPAGNGRIPEETEATTPLSSGKGTILVVDDENMILELGQEMLKALGYEVFSAGSGNEALKLYVQHLEQIDMVLLDMIMPEMSGGDVYDSLKKINPKVKVLLSSGYTIDGQAKEILNRGCDGFIQKPFDLGGLSRSVESILDNKHVWPSTS
jgi:two-component system cell cycle sensor histidine kinase/response regulator CckA